MAEYYKHLAHRSRPFYKDYRFEDELSDYFSLSPINPEGILRSSIIEHHACQYSMPEFLHVAHLQFDARALCALLLKLSHLIGAPQSFYRKSNVHAGAISTDDIVLFPSASHIDHGMQILSQCCSGSDTPATYRAAAAWVLLTSIHPFSNGNGRIARVLANMICRAGGMHGDSHLPIKEYTLLGSGGALIKKRRACFYGDWTPIFYYFCDLVGDRMKNNQILTS